ncbi:hypothetical protein STEG23_025118, partial [Scotinomys teguina]
KEQAYKRRQPCRMQDKQDSIRQGKSPPIKVGQGSGKTHKAEYQDFMDKGNGDDDDE